MMTLDPPKEVLATHFATGTYHHDPSASQEQEGGLQSTIHLLGEHSECPIVGGDTCLIVLGKGFKAMSELKTIVSRHLGEPGNTMNALLNPSVSPNSQNLPSFGRCCTTSTELS